MVYGGITAFVNDGKLPPVTSLDQAKRFVYGDLERAGIQVSQPDEAAKWIARLIDQEVARALASSPRTDGADG